MTTVGVLAALPLAAQTSIRGQIRPRAEARDPATQGADFTSMRVRIGLEHRVDERLSVFAQCQDVRIWGEERSTLADYSADALDLHQGWLHYDGVIAPWLSATVGRMEANLGGQRLVGAVGWTQQGRSFDGVRLDAEGSRGGVTALAFTIGDQSAPAVSADHDFYGVQATLDELGPGALEAYWLYDRIRSADDTDRHSTGVRYVWASRFPGRVEATRQTGSAGPRDVSASMVAVRVGAVLADGRIGLTLWYDHLSGDDSATPADEGFNTLYATNHKFYGSADLFLDVPVHTGGAGLQDLAVKASWRVRGDTTLGVDLHRFLAAERGTLSARHFGDEVDVTVHHSVSEGLTASAGLSWVDPDEALAEVGRLGGNMRWFYVMLDAVF